MVEAVHLLWLLSGCKPSPPSGDKGGERDGSTREKKSVKSPLLVDIMVSQD